MDKDHVERYLFIHGEGEPSDLPGLSLVERPFLWFRDEDDHDFSHDAEAEGIGVDCYSVW